MSETGGFDIIFPREYLRAGLIVSLLSIWVLVLLFYYLNRYTQRRYFTIWTAAWLFYALWLTLGITTQGLSHDSFIQILRQCCVGISAIFLLWGSLEFLEIRVRQTLLALFMAFLIVWSCVSPNFLQDPLLMQLPIFILIGLSSMFSGLSFYRLRKHRQYVGVGLLFFGFLLWGLYLVTYPFTLRYAMLFTVGFLISAVLQLFIAVSMIVLVLEEARYLNEQMRRQIQSAHSEKEALQIQMLSTEQQCRGLQDRTRLHEDLQEAYEELRQTQLSVVQRERLLALGQMVGGIAHDINNALSPVAAFAELMLKTEPNLGETSRKNLEHIRTAAEDIANIVNRMSDFYRRRTDHEQLGLVNMNRVVEQVVELTRPRWQDMPQEEGLVVRVTLELDESLPEIPSNESELREALTNLMLNSVDALPQGGIITIRTTSVGCTNPPAGRPEPSHIVVEVRDNGIGMDERTRQRCLEPFFSTKRDQGGTGLGLAMVYGVMERHEGAIEVESNLQDGTTVRLVFPIREIRQPRLSPTPTPTPPHKQFLHILCIDDEPLLRELLKEILEYSQHKVETADSGQAGLDAFQAARKRGEPFDVVITDLGMPYVDGRQVAQVIKGDSPDTPILMLTGWGRMIQDNGEMPPQVDAILCKPPKLGELSETLARVTGVRTRKAA